MSSQTSSDVIPGPREARNPESILIPPIGKDQNGFRIAASQRPE
jgi:hypothetical protein